MDDPRSSSTGQRESKDLKGIGFGIFILFVGLALLGERLGWLPSGLDWLFPAILIAWGASEIYKKLSAY
jgi:hypothetical protein